MALQPSPIGPEPSQPYTGPDFTGFLFSPLASSNGKGPFQLNISTQTPTQLLYQADIIGTWSTVGGSGGNQCVGNIRQEGGALVITCYWSGQNYMHTLNGILTYTPGRFVQFRGPDNVPIDAYVPPTGTLEGTVVVLDNNWNVQPPTTGPGNVSGPGRGPIIF
jgi:hypothetical protein